MSEQTLDVSVGARLWYQGSAWTVVEHDGAGMMLRSGDHFKKVHGPSLVGVAESLEDRPVGDTDTELDAVVLAALSSQQRAEVERQAKVFDELVLARSETSANDRYRAAAEELGISLRTAYRRGQRYAEKGLVGLVDTRRLQPRRPTIDPEWDAACLEVLQRYRDLSNPTIKLVLRKANAHYLDKHPRVPSPPARSPTVAFGSWTRAVTPSGRPSSDGRWPSDPRACWGGFGPTGPDSTSSWTPPAWRESHRVV